MCSRSSASLGSWQATALGALHGPAELLPVSSSAHVILVPWLLGLDLQKAPGDLRKSLEVALHSGTGAALLISLRLETKPWSLVLAAAPAAAAGLAFERTIEERLGSPKTTAHALLVGAIAMAAADLAPQRRTIDEASAGDWLLLGIAQTTALIPGVSRAGATLTAARLRRFKRGDALRMSEETAIPVLAGASALKLLRLAQNPDARGLTRPLVSGAIASFISALGSERLLRRWASRGSLLPYALYRGLLAAVVIRRLRAGRAP